MRRMRHVGPHILIEVRREALDWLPPFHAGIIVLWCDPLAAEQVIGESGFELHSICGESEVYERVSYVFTRS